MKIHHLLHRFVNCKLSDVGLTAKGGLLSDLCKLLTPPREPLVLLLLLGSTVEKLHPRFRVLHFNFYHTLNGCMYLNQMVECFDILGL